MSEESRRTLHATEDFIRKEKERYARKMAHLAYTGDIQGYLLTERDIQTMEITARSLRRYLLEEEAWDSE